MPDRVRALFVNEGSLGTDVMGQLRAADSLAALDAGPLEARIVTLPPMGRGTRLAVGGVPGLGRLDLDGHASRWHLAQSLRAKVLVHRALAADGVDVMHVHSHTIGLLNGRAMRAVPTVLSLDATVWQWHSMGIWRDLRPWSRVTLGPSIALERRALAAAALVVASAGWTAAGVRETCPEANVRVHLPGLDLARFHPVEPPPRRRLRVLFVGARFAAKGGHDLLEALAPRLGRDVELDLVTSHAPPMPDGVRHHRLAPDDARLAELYREADLFCMPTRGDAVPWAVLEAMASGVPVVAGDVGAIGELIDGHRAGRLVAPGDVAGLRTTLDALLDDAPLRRELGGAGRALCEQRHDGVRQLAGLVDLVREAAVAGVPA
jgi:glycosyltransferase involved in cell wall biosynthesis